MRRGKLSTVTAGGVTQSRVYDADGNVLLQTDPKTGTKLFLGETEVTLAPARTAASAVRTYTFKGQPVAERTSKAGVSGTKVTWLAGDLNNSQDIAVGQSTGEVTRRYTDPLRQHPRWAGVVEQRARLPQRTTITRNRAHPVRRPRLRPHPRQIPLRRPRPRPRNPLQNNGYGYSHNNPVTTSDPSGLAPGLMLADNGGFYAPPRAVGSYNTPKPQAPTSSSNGGGGGERPSSTSSGSSSGKGGKAKQPNSVMEVAKWVTNSDLGQALMIGCGFILILGSLCAGAESAAYAAQGRWGEAAISSAGIAAGFVVGAGAAVGAAKVAVKLSTRVAKRAEKAVNTGARMPQVLRVGDVKLSAVPKGTAGTPTTSSKGLEYEIPRGTPELSEKVDSVRIMNPVTSGKYQYPNGYAVYMNSSG